MIQKIIKRDGRVVDFDVKKIENAIWKAMQSVGEKDEKIAKELAIKVLSKLENFLKEGQIPNVEQVQDFVEDTLIEQGLSKVAKAYILYREKRAKIRQEKMQILNKSFIDDIEKRFDINALRILATRYLNKDENGKVVESVKEMFERVAINIAIPSILYDKRLYREVEKPFRKERIDIDRFIGKLKIGSYLLNRYHLETLVRVYERLNSEKKMKRPLKEVLRMVEEGEFDDYEREIEEYFDLMASKKFLPNTPALVNFGNPLGAGMACFALGMEDSLLSIMETLKNAAMIFQSGGGCGYNFSKLRPEGDFVRSTHGVSSGPIAFMTLFDKMTEVIKQGGVRRGANIGILNSDHPDIEKFIVAKKGNQQLTNFNISVLLREDFWYYYNEKKPYPLINPRNNQVVKEIDPENFLNTVAYQGWESAEPGILFEDNINRYNPFLKTLGKIETTNPCGEVLLYPNESCDLGSINLLSFVQEYYDGRRREVKFDWQGLEETVKKATNILDNILDANRYPLKEIEQATLKTRKIGLGVMGVADTLFELGIPYNSQEGFGFMEKVMEFINYHSKVQSIERGRERGSFPYFGKSFYTEGKLPFKGFYERDSWSFDWQELSERIKREGLRNAYTTVIAPTGSISMIAGCSSGIEPVFSLVYKKEVSVGSFYYINPVFEKFTQREGIYDEELIEDVIENDGSCQEILYIPDWMKKVFKTAMDIPAIDHINALSSFQKWVDSSVSKTINFPHNAGIEDIKQAYLFAHKSGCKGLTVFRYSSIKGVYKIKREQQPTIKTFKTEGDKTCPICGSELIMKEGCKECPNCGWSACQL